MPQPGIRLPITNHLTGSNYTGVFRIGANALPANLILDTGSSMLAVGVSLYDPAHDTAAKTSTILQIAQYLSGSFVGGIVQTGIALSDGNDGTAANLPGANLAVIYEQRPDVFGKADGIWGLAYKVLDNAYKMPADTWQNRYDADQIGIGQACDLDPYFDQLTAAGVVGKTFAFSVKRALMSSRSDTPQTDLLNAGTFVLGGGQDCTDLYAGAFTTIAIVDEHHCNTNLLSVQVGNQPPIPVSPVAPASSVTSNSIVDSGTSTLILDQDLYDRVMASFAAISPDFAAQIRQFAFGTEAGLDQTKIDMEAWPALRLAFQATGGSRGVLTVAPGDYWQFDAQGKGMAVAVIGGDNGMLGGQSILGLPLFCGYFVVFDRTLGDGRGVISFARQPSAGV